MSEQYCAREQDYFPAEQFEHTTEFVVHLRENAWHEAIEGRSLKRTKDGYYILDSSGIGRGLPEPTAIVYNDEQE